MKNYSELTAKEKTAALHNLSREALVEQLLRVIRDSEKLTETKNIQFADMPDQPARAYGLDALPTIKPAPELEHRAQGTAHRLLIGDNIDALMGLSIAEAGTFDLIYIDPPYNTGNKDFTYNDRFVVEDDSWRHTKWLNFMEPRLRLARELLSDTGVIFAAIDDNEHHHLRALMDSVFKESNFIANITWQGGRKNNGRFVSDGNDYMLVYAKSKPALIEADIKWRDRKANVDEVLEAGRAAWNEAAAELHTGDELAEHATKKLKAWFRKNKGRKFAASVAQYHNVDAEGRVFRSDNLSAPDSGHTYDIYHPVTARPVRVPSQGWRATPETMNKWIDEGLVIFGKDHTTVPAYKRYLDGQQEEIPTTSFHADRSAARSHLEDIIGKGAFTFPKDHNILMRWFRMAAPANAKVLDFFAGSGSTAEAVLALNAEDGGTRTFTLATNDESNIGTNVTRERVVRCMTGENWADPSKAQALGGQLAVYRVGQTEIDAQWSYSATLWAAIGRWPFATDLPHGVLRFDNADHTVGALASTEVFPADEQGEMDTINPLLTDDIVLFSAEIAPDLPRFWQADESIGDLQMSRIRRLRRHAVSGHSVDFNAQMQELLTGEGNYDNPDTYRHMVEN